RGDRLALADDDAVHPAHLARLRRDAQPAGSADKGHRGLVAGAHDLESRGASRIGERAAREERAAPDGGQVVAVSGRETVREAADGAAAGVEQSRLAREGLAALDD